MRILAIDPATNCGWCVADQNKQSIWSFISGTWDLRVRRDESSGMRLIRLRAKLNEIHHETQVNILVFEAARHAAPKTQGALTVHAELQGIIKLWCEDNHVEYRGYSPSEIKKHATGKGNVNKGLMMAHAHQHWPNVHGYLEDWTSDEADARWLADLFIHESAPVPVEGS